MKKPTNCNVCHQELISRTCDVRVWISGQLVFAWTCEECFAKYGVNDGTATWFVRTDRGTWVEERLSNLPPRPRARPRKSHVLLKVSPPPEAALPPEDLPGAIDQMAQFIADAIERHSHGFDGTRFGIKRCADGVLEIPIRGGYTATSLVATIQFIAEGQCSDWKLEPVTEA